MSKTKILNQVIETSAAMNCMCHEVAKCISPKSRESRDRHNSGSKLSSHEKRK